LQDIAMTTQTQQQQAIPLILRRKQVEVITGLARSTIYAKVKTGKFPRPVRLGKRAVGWRLRDIEAFLSSLPEAG
jgi:prophage regulatory protein